MLSNVGCGSKTRSEGKKMSQKTNCVGIGHLEKSGH